MMAHDDDHGRQTQDHERASTETCEVGKDMQRDVGVRRRDQEGAGRGHWRQTQGYKRPMGTDVKQGQRCGRQAQEDRRSAQGPCLPPCRCAFMPRSKHPLVLSVLQVNHPNIVHLIEVFEIEAKLFLVLDLYALSLPLLPCLIPWPRARPCPCPCLTSLCACLLLCLPACLSLTTVQCIHCYCIRVLCPRV